MPFSGKISVWLSVLVIAVALLSDCAFASSQANRPLKRLAHPSTLSIEILPRTKNLHLESRQLDDRTKVLHYSDSFRLVLTAFEEKFYVHLRPNDHLIHPAARITHLGLNGETRTEPLLRESVKAYLGEVIHEDHTSARMREDAAGYVHSTSGLPRKGELGWARIIVWHPGDDQASPIFEGAFSARGEIYHVMTKDNYLKTKGNLDADLSTSGSVSQLDQDLVIWRDSDFMSPEEEQLATGLQVRPESCGHDRLEWNRNPDLNTFKANGVIGVDSMDPSFGFDIFKNFSLARRDDTTGPGTSGMSTNFVGSIGQTDGCPTTQKILYMGVAADCEYVAKLGNKENATQKILNNWNMASALYKSTFKVSLGIVELQIQEPTCPTNPDPKLPWNVKCDAAPLDSRLSIFSEWRGNKGNDGIGLWHLMSGCPTGSEVGIAWLSTLCQQSSSGKPGSIVSGTGVSTGGITEWQVVAHEIGHNFGAIHDCTDKCQTNSANCCPLQSVQQCDAKSKFIMSPVAQSGEQNFSQCTIGNVCSMMKGVAGGKTDTSCLVDPLTDVRQTISLKMCGNGIVEPGEDCDPGMAGNSNCCDPTTCKFKPNAVCDPLSSPCCTDTCRFAPATQVCRPSRDDRCDTAEMCTGTSGLCPKDITKPNGQSCGANDLACASGQCTSVAAQCQTVGASMGLKNACPNRDSSCRVSCQDPTAANSCVVLSSLLVDGSPCGYGGTCGGGKCQAGSLFDTAKAWYVKNLQIAIPVSIVAGIISLLLIIAVMRSICRCVRGSRRPPPQPVVPNMGQHQRLGSTNSLNQGGPYPTFMQPPNSNPSGQSRQPSDWVDHRSYNGR